MRRWLLPTLLLAALLGAWQLAASSGFLAEALGLESYLVPSPPSAGEGTR
jgi:ABC-type nitrate/sulfonate/bicarbonate transport system permease component